jgi:hypothetical protein
MALQYFLSALRKAGKQGKESQELGHEFLSQDRKL